MNRRNVEIKAKVESLDSILAKAKKLDGSDDSHTVKQYDTFFKVSNGRLKIRTNENSVAEYIYYERPNVPGPKLSNYTKIELNWLDARLLKSTLSEAIGVLGVVTKTRLYFITGQTRIHIDYVEKLGTFVELEVILREDQDTETGQKIIIDLMQELSITEDNLIAEAYIDLLKKDNTQV